MIPRYRDAPASAVGNPFAQSSGTDSSIGTPAEFARILAADYAK